MNKKDVDFLIIGQGLAGSLLALELLERNQSLLVLDNKHHHSASKVAAGLINPITGHRLNITQGFFQFFNVASKRYPQLEKIIDSRFYHPIEQLRLIKNQGQHDFLQKRKSEAEYDGLLIENNTKYFNATPFGQIGIANTAYVDTKTLLESTQRYLISHDAYLATKFDYDKLKSRTTHFEYEVVLAKNVVFCEGFQAINNPWLKSLPFKLSQGEILTIEHEHPNHPLLSWGNWLAPFSGNTSKLGSNYVWGTLSCDTSAEIAKSLMNSLHTRTMIQAKIINQEAGVRPTTKYRTPFVGPLSSLDRAFCLNGLGSKGCLIAPHYARLLAEHMIHGKTLRSELTQWL